MELTDAQKATLKAAVLADPVMADWWTQGNPGMIADLLNATATPDFIVWRTDVTKDDIYGNGFAWVQVDNVTEPKWRVWQALFDNQRGMMNASKPNVRAGVAEVWSGTAAKNAVRDYVLSKCKRKATVLEKILATGTGTEADPATMGVEGWIGWQELDDVMRSGG